MAAKGDAFVGKAINLAAGAYADIRPAVGEEVSLAYVFHGYPGELYLYDGTNLIPAASDVLHCLRGDGIRLTNTIYARFKNTHSAAQNVAWSGVYTKTTT